jgi:hypothetical protein
MLPKGFFLTESVILTVCAASGPKRLASLRALNDTQRAIRLRITSREKHKAPRDVVRLDAELDV